MHHRAEFHERIGVKCRPNLLSLVSKTLGVRWPNISTN